MPQAVVVTLILASFFGFFALIVFFAAKQSARAHKNLEQLATRLGLTIERAEPKLGMFWPSPRAKGELRGKDVELYNYSTGSGKSRRTWSALAVTPRLTGKTDTLTFEITRQGFGAKVLELFGVREIQVGDAAFDALWFIRTNQPEFFQAALIPELRTKLMAAYEASGRSSWFGAFKRKEKAVIYIEVGDFSDERRCERFAQVASIACDLADVAEVYVQTASSP